MKTKLLRKLRNEGRSQINIISVTTHNNINTGMCIGTNGGKYANIFNYGDTEETVYQKSVNIFLYDNIRQIRNKYQKYTRKHKTRKRDPMFNKYWDWSDFSIGFSISKPHKCTGWNWYISIDLTFLSMWMYF